MLSSRQREQLEEKSQVLVRLKQAYKAILGKPFRELPKNDVALENLLEQLDRWHDVALTDAKRSVGDCERSHGLLQQANSYDIVRSYIRDKLS